MANRPNLITTATGILIVAGALLLPACGAAWKEQVSTDQTAKCWRFDSKHVMTCDDQIISTNQKENKQCQI